MNGKCFQIQFKTTNLTIFLKKQELFLNPEEELTTLKKRVLKCLSLSKLKPSKKQYHDILLNKWIGEHKNEVEISLKLKRVQMKIGKVWEEIFIEFGQNVSRIKELDLERKVGDEKFGMELKNNYNTDNSGSRKNNFEKLFNYGKKHKGYDLIYGIVNPRKNGDDYLIRYKNTCWIRCLSGECLLNFILGNQKSRVVSILKNEIHKILE